MAEKTKVAVLVSGGGTNLQAIIDREREGLLPHMSLSAVISSNPDAY
ncbi:MAG: phosphoribosylglycinamide formyltransferase, partial [Firmicutes bacterium]|nr:phosphoribosylglycinamide formyltransferase [Bacillota bacterium]